MSTQASRKAVERIEELAACVVLETPARSQWSYQSYVRRSLIADIETALVEAGYDMASARKRYQEIRREKGK